MKNLLFVARVAFISNVCMAITFVMRYVTLVEDKDIQSTIIIAGFLLSFIGNLITALAVIILVINRRTASIRPAWLFTVNFLCFIFQIYFLLK